MNILGIETSCDETAAAVVKNGRFILSNVVVSSLKEHSKYGGIIPEIASRRQMECINPIVEQALSKAKLKLKNIDAVAVTTHPGLIGSLLVGASFARALAFSLNKPLIEVDHIKAHIYANCLRELKDKTPTPKLPAIGLVVSGGHTQLYRITDWKKFKLLGQTRDDAAGEAFDKVARILDLGYPGGPVIDKLAANEQPSPLKFKPAEMKGSFDFSFSGVKTAVLYHTRDNGPLRKKAKAQTAYAFQDSVVSILVKKCIAACQKYKSKTLLIGGGVAANSALRKKLDLAAQEHKIRVYFPPLPLCLDNAAMIAGFGYQTID